MEDSSRKPKKRQKLCYNCEGEVDLDVIVCPFCAADLREERPEQARASFPNPQKNFQDQMTSQSLYAPVGKPMETPSDPEPNAESKNIFTPTVLFTLGVQLVVLGLLMLLFSHKGVVILKWNASWWFLYSLLGCPFLYLGYRALSKL